ncbi:MAG: hypothetical protein LBB63_01695 [Holosporaceae bacterium]|jgi:hypothetical protein|nr:hypothetical protein [Holosporaceae bacterium]
MKKNILLVSLVTLMTFEFNACAESGYEKFENVYQYENIGQKDQPLDQDDDYAGGFAPKETPPLSADDASNLDIKPNDLEKISSRSPFLEEQARILDKISAESGGMYLPVGTLERVTKQGISVTADTLEDFTTNPAGAIVRIDLFDGVNLFVLMRDFVNTILDDNGETGRKLTAEIGRSDRLPQLLRRLRDSLSTLSSFGYACFEDEGFSAAYSSTLETMAGIITLIQEERIAEGIDYFREFFRLGIKLVQLALVRHNTQKIFSQTRVALEGIQGKTATNSANLSISIPLPVPGLSANIDSGISESWGANALSFYTLSKSVSAKGGVTIGFDVAAAKAKLSGKVGVDTTINEIFYSLEGLIDHLMTSNSRLDKRYFSNFKEAVGERKNLQEKEKEIQKATTSFVFHLKAVGIMPQNIVVRLTDITKSASTDHSAEIGGLTEGSADMAVSVGVGDLGANLVLKASKSRKIYSKNLPILYLINSDCSIGGGVDFSEAKKIIGEEFDNQNYNSVIDLKLLLMDLTSYIIVLDNLAKEGLSKSNQKAFADKKHALEARWSPKKTFGSYGRDGMLRSFMLTALRLSQEADRDYDIIRRKIYEQLCVLAKFGEFSRNKTGIRKAISYGNDSSVSEYANADVTTGIVTLKVTLPLLGNSVVSLTRQTVTGSPFLEENCHSLAVKITAPISSGAVLGIGAVKKVLGRFTKEASKKGPAFKDFVDVANALCLDAGSRVATKLAGELVKQTPLNKVAGLSMSATTDVKIVFVKTDKVKDYSDVVPLPDVELVKKDGKWIMDSVIICKNKTLEAKLNAPSSLTPVGVGLNNSILRGELLKVVRSLHDLKSKYNALSLGICDNKTGESTAIKSLMKGQSTALFWIFRSVATGGAAAFELQQIFDELSKALSEKSKDTSNLRGLFTKLIDNCRALKTIDVAPAGREPSTSSETGAAANNNPFSGASGGANSLSGADGRANPFSGAGGGANSLSGADGGANPFSGADGGADSPSDDAFGGGSAKKSPNENQDAVAGEEDVGLGVINEVVTEQNINVEAAGGKNLMDAINLLGEILKLYHTEVFRPYYDNAFKPRDR